MVEKVPVPPSKLDLDLVKRNSSDLACAFMGVIEHTDGAEIILTVTSRRRIANLLKLGTTKRQAILTGISRKGYWRLSKTLATHTEMTNEWLKQQGYSRLVSFG